MKKVFEDESIMVVDKPAGMIVDEVATQTRALLVHRLDKDTSGVMVLAKTLAAAASLKRQFEERRVVKKYLALVHGQMREEGGLITTPVRRYPKDQPRSAITEWKRIRSHSYGIGSYTLLELTPHTGRTHQLRLHLQSIGHPIVADPIYGFRKKLKDDLKWCPRLFLHAKYLQFTHPGTDKKVSFESLLPQELSAVLDARR